MGDVMSLEERRKEVGHSVTAAPGMYYSIPSQLTEEHIKSCPYPDQPATPGSQMAHLGAVGIRDGPLPPFNGCRCFKFPGPLVMTQREEQGLQTKLYTSQGQFDN